jgi:hypothetical protein
MAANNQIINPSIGSPSRNSYAIRVPYLYQAKHFNDQFLHLGYDYHSKILKKMTSSEIWGNPMQISLIGQIEMLITYILEETKMIKKWMSIAHDKNTLNIS